MRPLTFFFPLAQIIRRNFDFLTRALGTAVFRRILRESIDKLQEMLWSEVLMQQRFSTSGAARFMRDIHAIISLVERYVPEGPASLASLNDGVKLLNLPVEPEEEGGVLSLQAASDRIFTDNAEAKKVLQELGIDTLTPANARNILQRRVENSD